MERPLWERVEAIYHAALPLAADERAAYLAGACGGDAALLREVSTLLAADVGAEDFLREPAAGLAWALLSDDSFAETLADTEAMPHAPADLVGTKVAGRYEVTERLGEGGFGEVYKAFDANLMSRPVVVKVLKDAALREAGEKRAWLLTKFRQEIEALSRVQDPGVVSIFDADTLPDGRPYLVMEFVRGTNLRDHLRKFGEGRGLPPRDVADIVGQAARTLTAAHDAEIVHRDLKPENVMVRRGAAGDLHVKVIDFGIAKVRNSLVAASVATQNFNPGTWLYMSPEQLNRKKVGPACDIYALGVIAYELLTGRPPFPAADPLLLRDMQREGVKVRPRDLNPELPVAAQESILKALSFLPADRHEKARDFGDELARALSEEPAPLAAAPTPGRRKFQPLSRRVFIIAAVVLLALLAGYAGLFANRKADRKAEPEPSPPGTVTEAAAPRRSLTYWLSMQRPRDAKPFDTIGERVFEPGSQFWFNVQTTQEGALYLFAEGHEAGVPSELNTLFPTPKSGQGSALVKQARIGRVTQNPLRFRGTSGTIYLWVIWAERPLPLIDDIVFRSYETGGRISNERDRAALRTFIEQHRKPRPEVLADDRLFRVTLRGSGETLVDVRRLEYQP